MNPWHDISSNRVTPDSFWALIEISKGSKNEVLSVPLQQTASYVYFRNNELTKDEIETIDKIIEIFDFSCFYVFIVIVLIPILCIAL